MPQKTITRAELCRLSFCNSKHLPMNVNLDGQRLHWVGIGWLNEGEPIGDEVLVIDPEEEKPCRSTKKSSASPGKT